MRRVLAVLVLAVVALACSAQAAGGGGEVGRLVWEGGGRTIFAVCDSETGNLVYAAQAYSGTAITVVPGGCK